MPSRKLCAKCGGIVLSKRESEIEGGGISDILAQIGRLIARLTSKQREKLVDSLENWKNERFSADGIGMSDYGGGDYSGGDFADIIGKIGYLIAKLTNPERAKLMEKLMEASKGGAIEDFSGGAIPKKRGASAWVTHVKNYAQTHGVSYRQALQDARPSYRKKSGGMADFSGGSYFDGY